VPGEEGKGEESHELVKLRRNNGFLVPINAVSTQIRAFSNAN